MKGGEADASAAPRAPSGDVPTRNEPALSVEMQGQLRGSSMLLAGRIIAIALNFLVQVLTVRFLTRDDYGSFSFALSIVALTANVNMLGLGRAMSRYGALYGEDEDSSNLVGAMFVSLGTIVMGGGILVAAALAWNGHWQPLVTENVLSQELLLLLVTLVPLTAIDAVLEVLAASFAGARAILVRRHFMTPLLRLAAVGLVMALGQGPRTLAVCYLAAAAFGVAAYLVILGRAFKRRKIALVLSGPLPARPVLGYGASMLLVDIAGVCILHLPAVALEIARGSTAVAGLRAVTPLATLTLVIFQSFKLLYVPLATRSFERGGRDSLTEIYWASARWLGLLTYPVFAACAFLSPYFVVLLFGEEYADASLLASIMTLGYYLHAILGVNTLTLQALGEGRRLRTTALAGIGTAVAANALLVPLYGAVGAAVATSLTLLAHDLTNLALVLRSGAVGRPARGFARPYVWVVLVSLALFLFVTLIEPPPWAACSAVTMGVVAVWRATRDALNLRDAFPELERIPLLRWILS